MLVAIAVVSLVVGVVLVIYGLFEGFLDYQEHKLRNEALSKALKAIAQGGRTSPADPDADLPSSQGGGEQHGDLLSVEHVAKLAESVKGLPRCVQVFFVAALFFIFAVITASVGTVAA